MVPCNRGRRTSLFTTCAMLSFLPCTLFHSEIKFVTEWKLKNLPYHHTCLASGCAILSLCALSRGFRFYSTVVLVTYWSETNLWPGHDVRKSSLYTHESEHRETFQLQRLHLKTVSECLSIKRGRGQTSSANSNHFSLKSVELSTHF